MYMAWISEYLHVARKLSITAAARELNMSQPNLSRHLKQLEAELGFKLFVVQNRRIHLTRAGMHFLDNASSLEKKFNKMVGECRELAASEVVPLYVKEPPFDDSIAREYLAFLNGTLNESNHYHLVFVSELSNRTRSASIAGDCDIDIVYASKRQVADAESEGWHMHRLGSAQLGVWVEHASPFACKDELSLAELEQIVIGFPNNPRHPLRNAYISFMEEAGFTPNYCEFQVEDRYSFLSSAPPECGFLYPADLRNDYKMQWRGDLVFVPLCEQAALEAFAISKRVEL